MHTNSERKIFASQIRIWHQDLQASLEYIILYYILSHLKRDNLNYIFSITSLLSVMSFLMYSSDGPPSTILVFTQVSRLIAS